jgi:hypothetical protein
MTPEHHEDRLCAWAEKTGRPVLSLDYGKAPERECNLLSFTSMSPPTFWIPNRNFYFGDVGVQREVVRPTRGSYI